MRFKSAQLRKAAIERLALNEDFRQLMGEVLTDGALPCPFKPIDPCASEMVRGKERAAWRLVELLGETKQGALLVTAIARDVWTEKFDKTKEMRDDE